MSELTPDQVVIIGLVASGLVILLRLAANKLGWNWLKGKFILTIVLSVVTLILAVIFAPPQLPAIGDDFWAFLSQLIGVLSAYNGFANLIYNLLLSKVADALADWFASR